MIKITSENLGAPLPRHVSRSVEVVKPHTGPLFANKPKIVRGERESTRARTRFLRRQPTQADTHDGDPTGKRASGTDEEITSFVWYGRSRWRAGVRETENWLFRWHGLCDIPACICTRCETFNHRCTRGLWPALCGLRKKTRGVAPHK